jgi:sulfatase maturation enzyme AslB (radical SAM superfamily)
MVREPRFDILNGSFDSAWEGEIATLVQKTMNIHAKCSNCSLIGFCDTCAGWGMMEAGDPEAPTEYLCRVARERSLRFGAEQRQEAR